MKNVFRVKGWFEKKGNRMDFSKEIVTKSEERAVERLYSDLGSKHAVKRNMIHISDVSEIDPEDAENPDIRALAEEE